MISVNDVIIFSKVLRCSARFARSAGSYRLYGFNANYVFCVIVRPIWRLAVGGGIAFRRVCLFVRLFVRL